MRVVVGPDATIAAVEECKKSKGVSRARVFTVYVLTARCSRRLPNGAMMF